MRWAIGFYIGFLVYGVMVGVDGCSFVERTAVAPKELVEGCVAEAYPQSKEGWGPNCAALNEWMKLNDWFFGGGAKPPPQLTDAQRKKLEAE